MAIYSSHYALMPNGTLMKNPLLYVGSTGIIEKLESTGDRYREVHSAQFFSGLLIPGFLVDLRGNANELQRLGILDKTLSRFYSEGVSHVVLTSDVAKQLSAGMAPTLLVDDSVGQLSSTTDCVSPWSVVLSQVASGSRSNVLDLLDLLDDYLVRPWERYANEAKGGRFQQGFCPGVYVVTGIEWPTLTFRPNPQIKKLA